MSTTHPTASDIDSSGSQIANIRFKRSTAAIWSAVNPILLSGEPGYETDTKQWKIGDGTTRYNDLDYKVGGSSSSIAWGNITGKPSSFVPSAHTHPVSDITGFQAAVSANSDVAAIKAIVGTGITDGDAVVNTLAEMLAVFSTYQEGVNIATTLSNLQNKRVTGIVVTGTSTKNITITFSDNTTISTTFTDLNTGGGGIGTVDTTIVSGSANAVSGGAVFSALAALTAASVIGLTSSASITWDYTAGKVATLSLAHNATLAITGANNGDSGYLLVTQNGGNKTLSLPNGAAFKINLGNAAQTALGWIKIAGAFVWTGDFIVDGEASISGNVISAKPVKQVHISGSSVAIADNTNWLMINGAGTFAAVAVLLPANPTDLQTVGITTDDDITTFSVAANTGHSIKQATVPTSMIGGETIFYRFTTLTWYRL